MVVRVINLSKTETICTSAGLAQSVERLTAERGVAGSIPGVGPILGVLKKLKNEVTTFASQMARPSRGSDEETLIQCPQIALPC